MIRFIATIVFLACSFSTAISQDFIPGYIIKPNGDSVSGFVANRSGKSNTTACFFKSSREGEKIKYLPNELKGYGFINDKYYESRKISIEKAGADLVFLEVLVKGKVSLYKYLSLFYLEKDSLIALSNAPQSEVEIGQRQYKTASKFIGKLNYLLRDCGLRADQASYSEKSLTDLIQSYNRCKGSPGIEYKTNQAWTKISLSAFSAADISSVKVDGFKTYSIGRSVSIPFGLGMDIHSPRVSNKTHLLVEVWYVKKLYQGLNSVDSSGTVIRNDLFLNASFLKIPIGLRHNFLKDALTPYLEFGLVHYFVLATSGNILREAETNNIVSTTRQAFMIKSKAINGFWIGGGLSGKITKHLNGFVGVRYELNDGFANPHSDSHSSGSTLNFLVGLKF